MAAKNNPSQTVHKMGASGAQVNICPSVPGLGLGKEGKGVAPGAGPRKKPRQKGRKLDFQEIRQTKRRWYE